MPNQRAIANKLLDKIQQSLGADGASGWRRFYYLKGSAWVSWGESQPLLPTSCLKTTVIKKIIEGEDLVLMFSLTFRAEHTWIFTGFRIQPSWVFPIASKIITVSYALSLYTFLNIIIRIQITYHLPLISEDLCYLFIWKVKLYPNFPVICWPCSKSEGRFNFEHGFWCIYMGL